MWGAAETAQWLRGLAAKSWGPEFRSQRKYNQASPETPTLRQAETEGSLELSGCQPGQENVDSTFKERSYLKGRGSNQGRNLTLSSGHCNKHTGAYTVCTLKHTHAHTIKIKNLFQKIQFRVWRDGLVFRAFAAFPGNLSLIPSTHIRWPMSTYNSSSKESNAFFWIQGHLHTQARHAHMESTQRHTHILKNKISLFKDTI